MSLTYGPEGIGEATPRSYPAERRVLRTGTVICDTRDLGIGWRVTAENWKALRAVGEKANHRLCDAQPGQQSSRCRLFSVP